MANVGLLSLPHGPDNTPAAGSSAVTNGNYRSGGRSPTSSRSPRSPRTSPRGQVQSRAALNEIRPHKTTIDGHDVSFDARGSFVHFAHHGTKIISPAGTEHYMGQGSVRSFMQRTGWYESRVASWLHEFLNTKCYSSLSMLALLVALFASDFFVLLQVPTDVVLDTILVIALTIFTLELILMAASDVSYPLSFFFFMDVIGTFSMMFDISFMLGKSAMTPQRLNVKTNDVSNNVIILRAARAARLGARAGRMSRVAKVIRFLSTGRQEDQDDEVKMANVISNKLSNMLSIRVAFLTICIAVVLPFFKMFEYPEIDESMSAWTQMLMTDVEQFANSGTTGAEREMNKELARFAAFYTDNAYGPFDVCYGKQIGEDDFECLPGQVPLEFLPSFEAPARKASQLLMSEGPFQVFFDMSAPCISEAAMSIGIIVFLILAMVIFSLILTNNITEIALTPLERMLSVVRSRCAEIFKYTNELQVERAVTPSVAGDAEEDYEKQSSEFDLLEKAVAKLVAIAHLSTKRAEPDVNEEMTEKDVLLVNWMQGHQLPSTELSNSEAGGGTMLLSRRSVVTRHSTYYRGRTVRVSLHSDTSDDDYSRLIQKVPDQAVESLQGAAFDALALGKEHQIMVAAYIFFVGSSAAEYARSAVEEKVMVNFMTNCEKHYPPNPFHNFSHALDVMHSVSLHLKLVNASSFLTEVSQFCLMLSAIGHDLGHLGVNNGFLVETQHELALTYNDRSPMENMHCSKLFLILSEPSSNILKSVDAESYKDCRKGIIEAILHTDVTKHNEMLKDLSLLYQMNSEAFLDGSLAGETMEVLTQQQQLMTNTLLHTADIGNAMKPWDLCYKWSMLVMDEFFQQGDAEKAAGIPVGMLNDREKANRPNSQIGFIEFMCVPLTEAIVHIFPNLQGLATRLGSNARKWANQWIQEVNPPEEAIERMNARVQKVIERCEACTPDAEYLRRSARGSRAASNWQSKGRNWRVE